VLVKAEAIGVNYFDLLIRTGKYRWMPKLPFILGNEMSGRVTEIGLWPHPDGTMDTAVHIAVEKYSPQVARPRVVPAFLRVLA